MSRDADGAGTGRAWVSPAGVGCGPGGRGRQGWTAGAAGKRLCERPWCPAAGRAGGRVPQLQRGGGAPLLPPQAARRAQNVLAASAGGMLTYGVYLGRWPAARPAGGFRAPGPAGGTARGLPPPPPPAPSADLKFLKERETSASLPLSLLNLRPGRCSCSASVGRPRRGRGQPRPSRACGRRAGSPGRVCCKSWGAGWRRQVMGALGSESPAERRRGGGGLGQVAVVATGRGLDQPGPPRCPPGHWS